MATFYFNGAEDNDWQTLDNWWTNSTFTTQATSLPSSSDNAIVSATVTANGGSEPTIANLTVGGIGVIFDINITVTGMATFNDSSTNNGTVNGDATFDSSYNAGTVNGDATFKFFSNNSGTVNGDATFSDSSFNATMGILNGNATFNEENSYNSGTITGDATFNGASSNDGTINGDVTFNGPSTNYGTGVINGNATFNDNSSNQASATVNGTATFSLTSANTMLLNAYTGTFNNVEFKYEKGINGSSILGVI